MIYAAKSITGKRELNQDCVFIPRSGEISLAMVADGMGGHKAGEVASTLAIETVAQELKRGGSGGAVALVTNAINLANTRIYDKSKSSPEYGGMGTTLVLALLFRTRIIIANVGDSRMYFLDSEKFSQVTKDHSYVAELVSAGFITKQEARVHPRRNLITRALGTRPCERVDIYEKDWEYGDTLLLCSDGLYSGVSDDEIERVLKAENDLQAACETLVDMALTGGSTDNVSIVVVKNEEAAL